MKYFSWLTIMALCLMAVSSHAASLKNKVQQMTLANGLTLLVVDRPQSPTFDAYITVGVGSVDEKSSHRGVAHLLEHMRFKGTKTIGTRNFEKEAPLLEKIEQVGSQIDRLKNKPTVSDEVLAQLKEKLKRLQAKHQKYVVKNEFSKRYAEQGGVGYNAFTSRDLTTYLISLPANKLELWARLESDRMRHPVLREFYVEREVVKEERRRRYASNPDGLLFEQLLATAYTLHPYRHPIIGWKSDIDNLTLEETRDFLEAYYAPVNTVIALVGDVRFNEAKALVQRYFGSIPPGDPVPPVYDKEPRQKGERRHHIRFDAEPQLMMAFHKPTLPHRDDYVFDLIDRVLSGGRSSRLYRALVLEKKVATSVRTGTTPGSRYDNLFIVQATPRHPHTLEEVEAAIIEVLDDLKTTPVSPQELERARNQLSTDQLRRLRNNGHLARMLTFYQTVAGDWRYMVHYAKEIQTLTGQDLQRVAQTYLVPTNRTVVSLSKEEK